MTNYETLLKKAYSKVKVISKSSERFEIPKVIGKISGKNTIITNIQEITDTIRRPAENLAKFLQKELGAPTKISNKQLVINTKLNSAKVNEKIKLYVKYFVICPVCGKPDTEIISEKGIKIKHCLACGAKSPIKYHL